MFLLWKSLSRWICGEGIPILQAKLPLQLRQRAVAEVSWYLCITCWLADPGLLWPPSTPGTRAGHWAMWQTSPSVQPARTYSLPFAWGFLDRNLSVNPLALSPGLGWALSWCSFCIYLLTLPPCLPLSSVFPVHFLWEAGQQYAKSLELCAEGSVTDLLTVPG